jgi:CTP synthase (UTP-ammonia lyase)
MRGSDVRIGVVGDYNPESETHVATGRACEHAAAQLGQHAQVVWIPTEDLAGNVRPLHDIDAVFIAPGSPYRSIDGALNAIRFARTSAMPLIGTCGGFQHVILEYARNVLGIRDARHAEYDPDAPILFVTALTCSLVGQAMSVDIAAGTTAAAAYGTTSTTERYYCNFGLNHEHVPALQAAGLAVSGVDHNGEVRIVELPAHPFFVATLFVPQVASIDTAPHPLVAAFVAAAHASSAYAH